MKNNQGNQTERAKRALVCCISDLKLKEGDQLPSHAVLMEQLGVGKTTIIRALDALHKDGIVEIRPKVGVFLCNSNTNGYIGRHIGIACMRLTHYPAGASLLQCLQIQLHDRSCLGMPFLRDIETLYDKDNLSLFNGLERNISQRRIDGLISTVTLDDASQEFLTRNNIPVVYTHNTQNRKAPGVILDYEKLIDDSMNSLHRRGFKRIALACSGYPITETVHRTFHRNAARFFPELNPADYCRILEKDMREHEEPWMLDREVRKCAADFLSMPPEQRPDAIIIPDDIITNIFYNELLYLQRGPERWMPHFVYFRNRQLPFFCSHENIGEYYLIDTMKIAELSVELLLEIIQNKPGASRLITYHPELIQSKQEE